jgi:hypothetical protein
MPAGRTSTRPAPAIRRGGSATSATGARPRMPCAALFTEVRLSARSLRSLHRTVPNLILVHPAKGLTHYCEGPVDPSLLCRQELLLEEEGVGSRELFTQADEDTMLIGMSLACFLPGGSFKSSRRPFATRDQLHTAIDDGVCIQMLWHTRARTRHTLFPLSSI